MNKEIRNIGTANATIDSRKVEGCAVKFDSISQDLGFFETIEKGAIDEECIKKSDIFARLDHRDDVVLARSRYGEGSLTLELRDDGLYYSFEAPHTQHGDELLEHLRRGEISTSSFAFSLDAEDQSCQRWSRNADGKLCRTISKIHYLYDVSPVFEPAYLATECSNRSQMVDEVTKKEGEINEVLDNLLDEVNAM